MNRTPDTVRFCWFNIYPNAFKSDRTAFSEYMLDKGTTDFYFATDDKRGYINRLQFSSGEVLLETEDHPLYLDVIKVIFDKPLAPGKETIITTPFHVRVPYNFDGIGYKFPRYQLRYWYPAVAAFVKPLTNADSSSNMEADYNIQVTIPAKFAAEIPVFQDSSITDSVKTMRFAAAGVNDVAITIAKPHHIDAKARKGASVFSRIETGRLISRQFLPALGYNVYDGLQAGILSHNYHKNERWSYLVAPVYTFRSQSIAGIASASYRIPVKKYIEELEAGFTGNTFSYSDGVDTNNNKVFGRLFRIVPFIRAKLPARSPKIEKYVTFKSYIINERDLEFVKYSVDSFFYPTKGEYTTRFVNELTFDYSSSRVLYPYHAQLQVQQGLTWYRANASGHYFFNYPKGGGMNVRVFASRFGYIGNLSATEKFSTTRFHPKLTAIRGEEDYTYSNYFVGRNEFEGLAGKQIMMRDGGLKLRTDLFEGLQGRSDKWVASVNVNTTIPQLFPVKIPLKIFLDAGTYAEAWDDDNTNPRFLYVAGLQLSLFKNLLNVYAPLMYSKQFRDQLKTVPEENTFMKRLSFSVDIQRLSLRHYMKSEKR